MINEAGLSLDTGVVCINIESDLEASSQPNKRARSLV